jgi:hypothetical protein
MAHNPYSPPKAPVTDATPDEQRTGASRERLYSVAQIAVGGFVGGAMAAAWLASVNHRATGLPPSVARVRIIGAFATLVVFALAVSLPDEVPSLVFTLAVAGGAYSYAQTKFAHLVAEHVDEGGAIHSWWRVIGVGLLVALISVGIALGTLVGLDWMNVELNVTEVTNAVPPG